jgi:hypothetical protein
MNVLIGFIPFAAFAILDHSLGTTLALVLAAALAALAAIRDRLRHRTPKLLDLGACVMFGLLAVVSLVTSSGAGVLAVQARVDAGLLTIVLISLAVKRPFTIDYAKERVPASVWTKPQFVQVNNQITLAWAGAFAAKLVGGLAVLYVACPLWLGLAVGVVGMACALYGTVAIPRHARAQAA